jgi:hypothetical protein
VAVDPNEGCNMTRHRILPFVLAWTVGASAADEGEDGVHEKVKKGVHDAADAVVGAGEKVSAKIQGRGHDGELAEGLRTNTGLGYGTAGCGLGSILFEPSSGFTQVFAATTNTSFGTQTFGITSGTSNCGRAAAGTGAAREFVEANRVALAKDIARGTGETISGLTRLGGCRNAALVGASLQRQFEVIFPNAAQSDRDVSLAVVGVLRADASLECRALG